MNYKKLTKENVTIYFILSSPENFKLKINKKATKKNYDKQ